MPRQETEAEDLNLYPSAVAAAINGVAEEIGQDIQERGFREDWDLSHWLEEVAATLSDSSEEAWVSLDTRLDAADMTVGEILSKAAEALRTNVLGTKIALMHSELSEALESLRDVGASGVLAGEGNVGEELADTVIRIADTAQIIKSPLGDEIIRKVKVNKSRPYKHGRKA